MEFAAAEESHLSDRDTMRARVRDRVLELLRDGGTPDSAAVRSMSDPALAMGLEETGRMLRRIEGVLAVFAAETKHRDEDSGGGFSRKAGAASAAKLVAKATRGTEHGAHRLVEAGNALLNTGEVAGGDGQELTTDRPATDAGSPPQTRPATALPTPRLGEAIAAGAVSAEAASQITRLAKRLHGRVDLERWARAEERLAEKAQRLTATQMVSVIKHTEAVLNPKQVLVDHAALREARYLRVHEDADGMLAVHGRLDPMSGGFVKTWIDEYAKAAFSARNAHLRDRDGRGVDADHDRDDDRGPVVPDKRTVGQLGADALVELASHAMSCDSPVAGGVSASIVVRTTLDDLETDLGLATIDGISQPIPAEAVRRMAADAGIIPVVLGSRGEVLDLGREQRLFTRAQKIALGERDGGCASCGAPPGWTHAHHIRWWKRDSGPTDLSNGVLLCVGCHHRVHDYHWDVAVGDDGDVWFTPPPDVDPARTPIRGWSAREVVAA